MTGPTEADKRLITELQSMLDQLAAARRGLYTRRPGCACDGKSLCALHAAVHNYLSLAADDLARAINQAQSEG